MLSTWVSVIVMLVAFVNGARNGECCSQNKIANLNGNYSYKDTFPFFALGIVIIY